METIEFLTLSIEEQDIKLPSMNDEQLEEIIIQSIK